MDARAAAIAEEQRHVERAYARLEELRARAEQRRRQALAAETTTHADLLNRDAAAYQAAARVQALTLGDQEPLVFGRLDTESGERHHIGRVSVLSEEYDPLVVDWRSDVAAAFYRATPAEPLGVHRRRIIHCRGPQVLTVEDQLLDVGGDTSRDLGDLVGDAALMAAITRERSEQMHDIVATIQREQDEIIRLPARGVTVVTGGPGTGKTAVALHRVAYLLYRHRERLERRGVLVIGPSRAFADYIASVLPSLGETTAVLRPLGAFAPGLSTDRHDRRDVARVKGDARMATVVRRYAERLGGEAEWRPAFDQLRSGAVDLQHFAGGVLRNADIELLRQAWREDHAAARVPTVEDVAIIDELRAAIDDAPVVVRRVQREVEVAEVTTFADRSARVDVGELIAHPDYSEFGHVVVDEAQDLSALQWRMVARRGREGSWTVVGDLAQRSTPSAPADWDDVATLLGRPEVRVAHLSVNYRTSAPIMTFAGRLLAVTAPGQQPPRSARSSDREPRILTGVSDVVATVRQLAEEERSATGGTVAIIAPSALEIAAIEGVVRHDPWTAKGLEFDAVLVVEPAAIADEAGHGALYVALTRATERLTVVTAAPDLPEPLRG